MLDASKVRVFTTMRCCETLGFDQLVMFFSVFATQRPGVIRSTHRIFGLNATFARGLKPLHQSGNGVWKPMAKTISQNVHYHCCTFIMQYAISYH